MPVEERLIGELAAVMRAHGLAAEPPHPKNAAPTSPAGRS
jgi:hypothetical protein